MNAREALRERLAELAQAFVLLTRLPVHRLRLPLPPMAPAPAGAVWAYPLAGAAIGAIGGGAYWLAQALSCPPALAALWALAVMILVTGALHEDGLADFADGLAGATKEKSLAIMRDHHIGTYGVIALILSLAVRASAVALIANDYAVVAALVATGAASRMSAVLLLAALPPARTDGLSVSVGRPSASLAAAALGVALVLCWLLLPLGISLAVVMSAVAAAFVVGRMALIRLGGQTGDVLGAAAQLAECLGLTVLAVFLT